MAGSGTRIAGTLLVVTTAVTGIVTGVFNKIGERGYDRLVENCVDGADWSICDYVLRLEGIPLPRQVAAASEPQPATPAPEDPAAAPAEDPAAPIAGAAPADGAPTEAPASPSASGWFPQTSGRVLVDADVNGKSCPTLRIMRNEIFARYGHTFKTPAMRKHFESQPWYVDRNLNADSLLTPVEQQNVAFIRLAETRRECEV